jgi:23S rRNA pseudouridine1911/1915/1917 synthase
VHRLDKDTTGVVVVAKNVGVHAALAAQFSERSVDRQYVALALSKPRKPSFDGIDEGSIDAPIGRDQRDRRKMAVVTTESGKRAITNWRVIERMEYAVLLSLKLGTGRTHQIRVHLAAKGSPVLGDRTYGDHRILPRELARAAVEFGRQALHAATLGFTHPVTSKRLHFEAAAPADFEQLVERFRSVGSEHGA